MNQEAIALFRQVGDDLRIAWNLQALGIQLRLQGNAARAIPVLEEALALGREFGDRLLCASTFGYLAQATMAQGDLVRSAACFREALLLLRDLGQRWILVECLLAVAHLAKAVGQTARAARLLAYQEPLREASGMVLLPFEQPGYVRAVDAARAELGGVAFAAAWQEGRALTVERAIAEALAVVADPSPDAAAAPAAGAAAFGLSSREPEVLRLLARLWTDREIATALAISPYTVARHASNLFAKLGVANRREAAALAARHSLA
jgi:ATP/maltotriose-dependent transcriptional regulator MalT